MKNRIFLTLKAIFLITTITSSNTLTGASNIDQPELNILKSDDNSIIVDFELPGVVIEKITKDGVEYDLISMEGRGTTGHIGAPELPVVTKLFAIPDRAGVRIKSVIPEFVTYEGINPYPHQEYEYDNPMCAGEWIFEEEYYTDGTLFPDKWAVLGDPAIMRDYRVVPVTVNPIRINASTGEAKVLKSLHIEIEFNKEPSANQKTSHFDKSVSSFSAMYSGMIANLDYVNPNGVEVKGSLLIIHTNYTGVANILQPLIEWKTRRGYNVIVEEVSNNVSTTTTKNIIQNVYDTADPPLENVILIGDAAGAIDISCYTYSGGSSDHPYTLLEGDDDLSDIFIGRYSVNTTSTLQTVVNKILYYEKEPTLLSTDWYKKGAVMATTSYHGISSITVNRGIRSWWLEDGFTQVDTAWYNMGVSMPNFFTTQINSGLTALNVTGGTGLAGISPSNIMSLSNNDKLPFMVLIAEGTGDFGGSDADYSEAVIRAGTPSTPKGGIAGIGEATLAGHTRFNNTYVAGLWWGMHAEGMTEIGPMTFRGKYEIYESHQYEMSSALNHMRWMNLMGDPTTDLWTDVPQILTVTHPDSIPVGTSSITLTVADSSGNPLSDRYVCLWKGDETFLGGRTDENGVFSSAINVPTEGELKITVTYHNDYPYLADIPVYACDINPSFFNLTIDDDNTGLSQGNNDGFANPSESLELMIDLKNFGTLISATGITATLTTVDENVTITADEVSFADISPGVIVSGNSAFVVEMSNYFSQSYKIPFTLTIDCNEGTFISAFDIEVNSGELEHLNSNFAGGILPPGGTDDYSIRLHNLGEWNLTQVTGTLTSTDPQITIDDGEASFGDIRAGSAVDNSADPFVITADEYATSGREVEFNLHISSENGFEQDLAVSLIIGDISTDDPFGPDGYGYYCIDNTDQEYLGHPVYDWMEIDPRFGGAGTQLHLPDYSNEQDVSELVQLPFDFTFYGESFDEITVCSNGWIGFGDQTYFADFRNYQLPTPFGPSSGMLCPYWDDITLQIGGVFSYYDEIEHLFIIEYSRVDLRASSTQIHTFEIVFFDPAHYTTLTGDGEIIFQYLEVNPVVGYSSDNDYFTTGIMNHEHSDGLQYAYWNEYHPAAAELTTGRSIKFTTIEPVRVELSTSVVITATPLNPPIIIPAGGGEFEYDVEIVNNGNQYALFDLWIDITFPDGSVMEDFFVKNNIELTALGTILRTITQNIPGNTPEGEYIYSIFVGDHHPGEIWSQSGFNFTKSGVDASGSGNWDVYGWDESIGEEIVSAPSEYILKGAYPNPFNPSTDISFALPIAGKVSLKVYNTLGREVAILADGWQDTGWHKVRFDAGSLSSGIYFCILRTEKSVLVEKMVLLK